MWWNCIRVDLQSALSSEELAFLSYQASKTKTFFFQIEKGIKQASMEIKKYKNWLL